VLTGAFRAGSWLAVTMVLMASALVAMIGRLGQGFTIFG
jgi:hypothetical protein